MRFEPTDEGDQVFGLNNKVFSLVVLSSSLLIQGCTSSDSTSEAEQRILQSAAFINNFNVHDHVGDVHSSQDSIPASRPFHVNSITEAIEIPVRDCTVPGLYEMEKQMVLNEAMQDPTGRTVPVKFSYSFGKKHDVVAKYANRRAVLSETNGGVSYIPVGGKKKSRYIDRTHFYYQVDNTDVARQYRTGERCFFSTIQIDPDNYYHGRWYYDFIQVTEDDIPGMGSILDSKKTTRHKLNYITHIINYMYYGYCKIGVCAPDQAFAGEFANRLFTTIPSRLENGEPQIIKLYMADLRSEQMEHDIVRLSEDTTRGLEIDSSIDNILNVCEVHKNYHDVTKNLSLPKTVNGYEFDPIQGAVQLVENILSHDVDGTMMSSQYTPIVIDLDSDGVKTSSTRWGTYFNMAALDNDDKGMGQAHRTAWVGGDYVDYNTGPNPDSRVNLDVRIKSRDAFLVVPDSQGQVTSSTQMFGDNMMVGGQTYENGFLALQAISGKDCSSHDLKKKYLGPWDGAIYEDTIKLWIDENRNGVSDDGEIKTLRESGVAAINACHIVHADESDQFGNGTQLRSAVLLQGPYVNLLNREEEILYRLEYGEGYEGEKSFFSLAIDLIFQVDESNRCPAGARQDVDYPSLITPMEPEPPIVDEPPIGISSNEPPLDYNL